MMLAWSEHAWADYRFWQDESWQETDKKTLKRINILIKEIQRDPFVGIGDPEPLKHNWSGCWSRRIDREHRLVYKIENAVLVVLQCRFHH